MSTPRALRLDPRDNVLIAVDGFGIIELDYKSKEIFVVAALFNCPALKAVYETGDAISEIVQRLAGGTSVVLFAEGTSSDGNRVLPFRSALVGASSIWRP